jgi:hypothetical protein
LRLGLNEMLSELSPEGTSEIRASEFSRPWRDFSDVCFCTQDYVLGYFQTSLRDSIGSGLKMYLFRVMR